MYRCGQIGYNVLMGILDTLGKRLKALRADLGVSQTELAKQTGIPQSYISTIEADRVPRVSGDLLSRFADALGTTVDYLLLRTEDPLPAPEMQPEELPLDVRLLYQQIERLPPAVRDQAVEYLLQEVERMERLLQVGRRLSEWDMKHAPAATA